jgi:myo-inositol-1(or 4)-monophosphatase
MRAFAFLLGASLRTVIGTGIPIVGAGCCALGEDLLGQSGPTSGVRRFGSAALDLAWAAAGRMDGFWRDDLDLGTRRRRPAGQGSRWFRHRLSWLRRPFDRREYVAGSAAIHSKLQKLVAGALR